MPSTTPSFSFQIDPPRDHTIIGTPMPDSGIRAVTLDRAAHRHVAANIASLTANPDPALRQDAIRLPAWRVKRLERALRAERARARSGHRTYCVARHAGLLDALKQARAELKTALLMAATMDAR